MRERVLGLAPWVRLAVLGIVGCGGTVLEKLPPEADGGGRGSGGSTMGIGGSGGAGGVPLGKALTGDPPGDETGGAAGAGGAGTGGALSAGGDGGASGTTTPTCIPGQSVACACTNGSQGAQLCRNDGTYASCTCTTAGVGSWEQQQLARLRKGVLGTWVGTQTNPWQPPCATTMTFGSDGVYTAHSPGDGCGVFYYGTNDDSPEKTYDLNDIHADGQGSGSLAIYFGPGNTNLGVLDHIVLSDDENQLSFECRKDGYGPLIFSLTRKAL
jgi:hypothetical protein